MSVSTEDGPVVVVGVDGSPNSAAALRWAARYATLRGAELHAVIAWENVLGFGFAPISAQALEQEAQQVLERTVNKVLGKEHPLEVVPMVIRGNPTEVLVEAAHDAELLVVGDRGYGGFAGLLLGSVGENCVRQARCSVVVVRDRH